jgi:hypothetical protein
VNSDTPTTADAALHEAYQEWRRLAELEGEAIRARNWTTTADCQRHLSALQPRIIRLREQAREEWKRAGADIMARENKLRAIISGLIELESRNSSSLDEARAIAQEKREELGLAGQNLKRIQRSYAPASPAVWNSFS